MRRTHALTVSGPLPISCSSLYELLLQLQTQYTMCVRRCSEHVAHTADNRRNGRQTDCTYVDHVVTRVMSCIIRFVVVLMTAPTCCVDQYTAVPVDELPKLYIAAGLTGRLECPFDDDPPDSLVVWTKDGRPLDGSSTWGGSDGEDVQPRVRYGDNGLLVFTSASSVDEGVYKCLVYSPLHKGPESPSVQVLVTGQSTYYSAYQNNDCQ